MADVFAKSVTSYDPSNEASAGKNDVNKDSSSNTKGATQLQEDPTPIKSLLGKLTEIMKKSATGFEDVIDGDVVRGRQMAMRVASMIDETVLALNPVLTFINALITMLRATRYMLVMANFVG
jgi:hypothetical protein